MAEQHGHELAPTTEAASMAFRPVLSDGSGAAPVAVGEGRWRIEVRRPYFSGEDSLASNKAGAFLP